MKRVLLLLFIGFFGIIGRTQAKPLLYTFEGYNSETLDTAGAIEAAGITKGGEVSYTLRVDPDKQASLGRYSGSVLTHSDAPTIDYFHAELTLTSISKAGSVPEPSALFLLGCGPACITLIRKMPFATARQRIDIR